MSPFQVEVHKNYLNFTPKTINNKIDKIKAFLLTFSCISGIITYIIGIHRTPMIQAYRDQIEVKNNLTNQILLYMADCCGYIILILTYFYQYYTTKGLTKSMNTLMNIESKLKQNGASLIFHRKKQFYMVALCVFAIDMCLKSYDTFYLAYESLVPFHGVYEHIIRYSFITFMDLIILQWICFMELIKLYFEELIRIIKRIKHKQCWVVEDFNKQSKYHQRSENIIKDIAVIYDQLYVIAKRINLAYSMPFLLIVPICFVITTVTIFSLCKIIKKGHNINPFMTVAYMSYILRMSAIILPPFQVTEVIKQFISKLHCLEVECSNENTSKLVS